MGFLFPRGDYQCAQLQCALWHEDEADPALAMASSCVRTLPEEHSGVVGVKQGPMLFSFKVERRPEAVSLTYVVEECGPDAKTGNMLRLEQQQQQQQQLEGDFLRVHVIY